MIGLTTRQEKMRRQNTKLLMYRPNRRKLCSKRKHGSNIECQQEGEYFANNMASNIGNEEEWARQSFLGLAFAGLEVEHLTTDPDSSAYRAALQLYGDGVTYT